MPRFANCKVEVRFDQETFDQINKAATACGLTRSEFIRNAVVGNNACVASEVSGSVSKPPLTLDRYLTLVQQVYRALGGSVSRSTAELCVAVTVQSIYKG
jgi:hypothetical protein